MEIKYLGHSCFRLKTNQATVVTDPFNPTMVGIPLAKQAADIVTISHQHEDHNFLERITGTESRPEPLVFDAPGEYEAQDVGVVGLPSFHDASQGSERGKNTIFVFQIDGLLVAHLGDLGHTLEEKKIEELGPIDILIIPVGGTFTLSPEQAGKMVAAIGPSVVIPMHYKLPGHAEGFNQLATVEQFLDKADLETVRREDKLRITKDTLPEDTEVVILSF
jgi:L-ascorbate metabolism protein UlaG (beta-lactamase superfamily)